MGSQNVLDVSKDIIRLISIAGLDKVYEMHCNTCGYSRDYGYMWQTAEQEYDRHRVRYPDHVIDFIVMEAPLLTPVVIKQRIQLTSKGVRIIKTLNIESDLV